MYFYPVLLYSFLYLFYFVDFLQCKFVSMRVQGICVFFRVGCFQRNVLHVCLMRCGKEEENYKHWGKKNNWNKSELLSEAQSESDLVCRRVIKWSPQVVGVCTVCTICPWTLQLTSKKEICIEILYIIQAIFLS